MYRLLSIIITCSISRANAENSLRFYLSAFKNLYASLGYDINLTITDDVEVRARLHNPDHGELIIEYCCRS